AGGVADYFAIDPVFVRIAFVVLTFVGGAGVIAYVAGWLLVPEAGETTSLGEDALRNRNWARIAGFVLIPVAASIALRPLWWFGGRLTAAVALILVGLYLLAHHGGDTTTEADTPTPPVPRPGPVPSSAPTGPEVTVVAPSWPPPPSPPPPPLPPGSIDARSRRR